MKVDTGIIELLSEIPELAHRGEEAGFDGLWSAETTYDPFFPLVLAAEHTSRVELGTSIAVAFARTPMTVANVGWDLQNYSGGRFILGLGSQVSAHITKRFSMPWSKPAARMREYVLALKAIWTSWETGDRLDFRGDFYSHTLMTPFFSPGPNPHGQPKIYISAVNPLMTQVAGEVCDGIILHGFTTERWVREVTMPNLQIGADRAGRDIAEIDIVSPAFIGTGATEESMAASVRGRREQVSFYGSTPAYRDVLDLHGWGDLSGELNALSKAGRWNDMIDAVPDEVLDAFAIVAEPSDVAGALSERYGDLFDRVFVHADYTADPDTWRPVIDGIAAL
ncbi:MAG: LLM class F420-dependent oxidoreductase [Actinomycetota bacterium]|jgi:probable F420-dependent oxidoreductase|nr:LLM class F420-dependent oxidoreductase [Actinomycetota bacterium]